MIPYLGSVLRITTDENGNRTAIAERHQLFATQQECEASAGLFLTSITKDTTDLIWRSMPAPQILNQPNLFLLIP